MTELPSGTVTFLFTDIERSTESAAALGDERWAEALQTHRDLLRPIFQTHNGVEVGTEGDSFFVAFARAHDAVDAAADGQRALQAHTWAGETQLRVRMGLHTGEALVRGEGYVGHEVHRAKRISDAAHGGQILLSQTAADLVGKGSLLDLGSHRLKDLGEPQHVYQLTAQDLPREFPQLRSLDAFTHSLPLQRSAFIGREKEIAQIRDLIESNRIVTLTGVGGCGKTRLALQVGADELEHFDDGVFFVNLAPISDPDVVWEEIVRSVGAPSSGVITSAALTRPTDDLFARLGTKRALIVLDNCEHLVDACAEIVDRILVRCPNVSILATSREALRVEGEQSWSIPSLSLPTDADDAQKSESVSLFKARAQAVRQGFELTKDNVAPVIEICRRLDGIPLAIEFAAARVGHLSPRQIADRLDDRFRLLTGGQRRVQRQQTLQAALDWSFDLLEESERVLLRRLSVFPGDFSIDGAEGICSDDELSQPEITDLLGSLVSKSLVQTDLVGAEVRYKLLETVRAYATQQLTHSLEAEQFRRRHRDWFVDWIDAIDDEADYDWAASRRLRVEQPNIHAALEWSLAENRLDIVGHLAARVWTTSLGGSRENQRWVRKGLEVEDTLAPNDRLSLHIQHTMNAQWEPGGGSGLGVAALADEVLEGTTPASKARGLMMRGLGRAFFAAFLRDPEMEAGAYSDFDEAERLARDLSGQWLGMALWQRAHAHMIFGRAHEAWPQIEAAQRALASSGDNDFISAVDFFAAALAHVLAKDDEAIRVWRRFRQKAESFGGIDPAGGWAIFATLDAVVDGPDAAWSGLIEQRPVVLRSGFQTDIENLVLGCAIVHALSGDLERAAVLLSCVRAKTLGAGRALPSGAHYLLYMHYRDKVREALGAETAHEAKRRGEQMSLDEAVELAFADKVPA